MKQYRHPSARSLKLPAILQALSDPVRLRIVRQLLGKDAEFACHEFPLKVSKATRSHHFQILREAGLIRTRVMGTECLSSLRRDDLESRFPHLLKLLSESPR